MKRSFCLVFSLLFAMTANGQGLKIKHLKDNCYVFTTYKVLDGKTFPANGMYMITDEGAVMFDMPWDTTQAVPLLDSILQTHNKHVILSVSTHFHDDRTGAIDILKRHGVKTYSSKQTYDLCAERKEKQPEFYFLKDTTFSIGKHVFETYYPGPGHTKDNIVIWCNESQVLYGGCFVKSTESPGLGNVDDADVPAWRKSVKRVIRKYPKAAYIIPGHFGWESDNSLDHTLWLTKKAK